MKRALPYIIIVILSLSIIVAAWFVVPMFFENAGEPVPTVDTGDAEFINSIGGVSETYVGAVSEYSYSSVNDAAQAFVSNEVVGEAYADVINCESVGTYTASNVDIAIPAEFLEGADSIEKVNVTYSVSDYYTYSAMSSKSSGDAEATVVVYIIKYGPDFRYFVPMPETGNTISKSYYDSVFNSDKFQNCTLQVSVEETATITLTHQGQTEKMDMLIKLDQTIMYDYNKIYFYQRSETSLYGQSDITTMYAYIEEDEYGYVTCYIKYDENDSWMRGSLTYIGFSSLEELAPFYGNYLDYTYFSKTSYGFALEDENASQYFRQAFAQLMDSMDDMFDIELPEDGVDMIARYYVQDGALTGVQSDADINLSFDVKGVKADMAIVVNSTSTCTNYGSTVVERPVMD